MNCPPVCVAARAAHLLVARAARSTRCVAVRQKENSMRGETCNDCMGDESCHDLSDLLAARAAMTYNERGNCLNLEGVSALDTD